MEKNKDIINNEANTVDAVPSEKPLETENTAISTSEVSAPVADTQTVDKNAVFFEKFEKSKKDFLKEKRKEKQFAKKSIVSKNKLLGFESRLRDEDFIKKLWIYFIIAAVVLLGYASVVMGFLGDKFGGTSDNKWIYATYYSGLTKTSVIFSGIALSIIPLPYFYLLAAWFIGINSVHQSKYFVTTNIVILIIAAILLIIVVPLSSIIFNQTIGFKPLVSA